MLNWTDLEAACSGCRNCSLCETRHHVVFGEGLRTADLMFIGEGPGEQEDLTGRPCIGYLRNQVALIRPKIIVCLGRIAAIRLIREDFKITREHGQWFEKAGVHMMAMYHPSALLRDPRKRPEAFEDLKKLQAKIWEVCPETYAGVVPLGRNAGRTPS